MIGVEPTLPKKTDPKSVAAANYATSAFGGDRTRTCYLDLAKVLLYQMSYTPLNMSSLPATALGKPQPMESRLLLRDNPKF